MNKKEIQWYDLPHRSQILSTRHRKIMLTLLKQGITSSEEIASHLNVTQERVEKYIERLRRKKETEAKLNRMATVNTYRWARVLKKELGRRVGSSSDDLYYPITQALHNAADSLPDTDPFSFTLANMYRYIAGAGLGCPTQSTELMDCLFNFFKGRLLKKLEQAPSREEIKDFLKQKGEQIANFSQSEGPSRVFWSGQGRPPPGYRPEAYEKNNVSEGEFSNPDGGQFLRASALLNPIDILEDLLEKLRNDLTRLSEEEKSSDDPAGKI